MALPTPNILLNIQNSLGRQRKKQGSRAGDYGKKIPKKGLDKCISICYTLIKMKTGRKNTDKKEVQVQLRMSSVETEMLKAQAKRLGLSVSAYIRMLINKNN